MWEFCVWYGMFFGKFFEQFFYDWFDDVEYVFLGGEVYFYIELVEFVWCMVSMCIFVVEIGGDLEVMVKIGDYDQLFELLWGLWQGVEFVWVQVCWYQEVMCVFWGRCSQDWCLIFGEVFINYVMMNIVDDL